MCAIWSDPLNKTFYQKYLYINFWTNSPPKSVKLSISIYIYFFLTFMGIIGAWKNRYPISQYEIEEYLIKSEDGWFLYIHMYILYTYAYTYAFMCMCVCTSACVRIYVKKFDEEFSWWNFHYLWLSNVTFQRKHRFKTKRICQSIIWKLSPMWCNCHLAEY